MWCISNLGGQMSTATVSNFGNWIEKEHKKGLVDIKFAVYSNGVATVRAIKDELLATEAMIDAGLVGQAPVPTSTLPVHIMKTVESVRF